MPELVNYTPFPNFRYYSRDSDDREFGVIIVKATYELAPSGNLLIAEEQAPMMFTDLCHGAVNISSLWHPSDMVPNKPATDVIVNAVARTHDGAPRPSWECGIRIEDNGVARLNKVLRVTGPRSWHPRWKRALRESEKEEWQKHRHLFDRWELSEPDPIVELPLHYEYAYGGEIRRGEDEDGNPVFDTNHHNPLGRGKIDTEWTDHNMPVAAPQIESAVKPVSDPYEEMRPENLGPIPPAWLPRRPRGGTYDQNWKDNIWPAWPPDYDFAYHNSAHPDLVVKPYLKGTERVLLTGISGQSETVSFDLPGQRTCVDFVDEEGAAERRDMVLDTLMLDCAPASLRDWHVFLTWRVNFEPGLYESVEIRNVIRTVTADDVRARINGRSAA